MCGSIKLILFTYIFICVHLWIWCMCTCVQLPKPEHAVSRGGCQISCYIILWLITPKKRPLTEPRTRLVDIKCPVLLQSQHPAQCWRDRHVRLFPTLYMDAGDLNSGPHNWAVKALTEPSPHLPNLVFTKQVFYLRSYFLAWRMSFN